MRIIYNLGIQLYILALRLASIVNFKAKQMLVSRKDLLNRIKKEISTDNRSKIWFHCASLGEFEQIRPILEGWKKTHTNDAIIITFFSPSGYELRKNYPLADYIYYLPFDTSKNASTFIALTNPKLAIFAKYDIWYHYLHILKLKKIPSYLVSANFRKDQVYFKWYGGFFKEMLFSFTHIFSQFNASTLLLNEIGITHASTSGDTRYDRVLQLSNEVKENELIRELKSTKKLIVLGSSYKEEELLMASIISELENIKVIVAPHHINEQRLQSIESIFKNVATVRYSLANTQNINKVDVLILDNIGMLATLYHYANIAIVGGGFGLNGIHNILEPLSHGAYVFIGPLNHAKFPETKLAMDNKVLSVFSDSMQLFDLINTHIHQTTITNNGIVDFVRSNAGATKLILNFIK